MRTKIASIFVASVCLLTILIAFNAKISSSKKALFIVAGLGGLAVVYSSIKGKDRRSGLKNLTRGEGQKIIDENIDWIRKRWDRVQKEKDSGSLQTVGAWYFDEATDRQLSRIKRIGLSLSTAKITKGQASDIIGLFEPAEERDIKILREHNVPLERMNETKARELVAAMSFKLPKSDMGKDHPVENQIIRQYPRDFIYFVRFFDSRVRYDETLPEYVPKDDHYRRRYDQAVQVGLAQKGIEIPLVEKMKTLKLTQMSTLANGQKFTRKAPAIEFLMDVPDIVDRFESMTPIDDWFQLKKVKLDTDYLEAKWSELYGDDEW